MSVQEAGVVYHPQLDREIRSYPGGRVFLVRNLQFLAAEASSAGDAKLRLRQYQHASSLWAIGARYMRLVQSVDRGGPVDPGDYSLIAAAWRRAIEQLTRAKLEVAG